MSRTTYHDLFNQYLEERLRQGGDPDYMVSIARIYSDDSEHLSLHAYVFQEWLRDNDVPCGKCGSEFRRKNEDVSKYSDVVCPRCHKACKGD